jgi:hypothetical protein
MARQSRTPRNTGGVEPNWSEPAADRAARPDGPTLAAKAPRVDARTAEIRKRIAEAARIPVISSLLLLRR